MAGTVNGLPDGRDSTTSSHSTGGSSDLLSGGIGDDPSDGFLHKSSIYKCKKRRLLNCRKFAFRGSLSDDMGR